MSSHMPSKVAGRALTPRRAADITVRTVEWVWPNRIPLGKLTVIAGDPKTGKSYLSMFIAASVSTGRPWPDTPGVKREPGTVLVCSAEDDPEDTIVPRLITADANLDRVIIMGTSDNSLLKLDKDLDELRTFLEKNPEVRMVIIDPLMAFLGTAKGNDNQEVRLVLGPLAKLAEERKLAVVAITHLNKPGGDGPRGTSAMYRVMGSLGIVGAARSVWMVSKDHNDEERRLFLNVGMNLAKDPGGLAYRIIETPRGPVVEFESGIVDVSANEAIGAVTQKGNSKLGQAKAFIRRELSSGSLSSTELEKRATMSGISKSTLDRARSQLGVRTDQGRDEHGKVTAHYVSLPTDDSPDTCNDDVDDLDDVGDVGSEPGPQDRQPLPVGADSSVEEN